MVRPPFDVALRREILYLTLDTPGCEVNILSDAAAHQLIDVLGDLDRFRPRAVVFRSGKPGSFINGARLLMASAVRDRDDVERLTRPVRQACEAVAATPVPTLAAVEGTCFGCGVEFILNCDFRLARAEHETHFYMTEINDYLLLPAFDGALSLPRRVGLKGAIDLLLWGERWFATEALERNLVDAVWPREVDEEGCETFLEGVLEAGGPGPKPVSRAAPSEGAERANLLGLTRARIDALPSAVRPLYRDGLQLMVHAADQSSLGAADRELALDRCAHWVLQPEAKAALSLLFVRQIVRAVNNDRDPAAEGECRVCFDPQAEALEPLRLEWAKRRSGRLTVVGDPTVDAAASAPDVWLTTPERATRSPGSGSAEGVQVVLLPGQATASASATGIATLYGLRVAADRRFFELASPTDPSPSLRRLLSALTQAGVSGVISRGNEPLVNDWMGAFIAALLAGLLHGHSVSDLTHSMREFGYSGLPRVLLDYDDPLAWTALTRPFVGVAVPTGDIEAALVELTSGASGSGQAVLALLDVQAIALTAVARRSLLDERVLHPAQVDVLAREVLGFPLQRGGLTRHLTRQRIGGALERAGPLLAGLSADVVQSSRAFVEDGPEFYLRPAPSRR